MYKVKCNKCGNIHEIDDVELEIVGEDPDHEMGTEYFYSGMSEVECDCGQQISITVEGSEYPDGAGIEIIDTTVHGGDFVH